MFLRPWLLLPAALILAACDEEERAAAPDPVRAIKHAKLETRAGLQTRRISGVVTAAISSNVAFETNGQVTELLRKAGDTVKKGDLIAKLDPEPYELRVREARNALAQAQATAEDARKKFEQQSRLRRQGFATKTAFDTAQANLKTAEGAVGVSQSQLEIAQRDLVKTDLKAPFDGVIARKEVEQFEEVTGGQSIYTMQTADQERVDAALPETLINQVTLGATVDVAFPPLGGVRVPGTVNEIAPLTGDANAYPIEVTLVRTPPGLRSGMSAEITFQFATEATGEAFLVPLAAVRPNVGGKDEATVFVFNPENQTIAARPVSISNVQENQLEIVGDLKEGEIIATAGVSFLFDGQSVTLFDPDSLR